MKFLCVNCDEGMKLDTTSGPREGSLEAIFVCPRCRYKIVMLTNPWETQLVQTLGVTIGGRTAPAGPYEQILSSLARPADEAQEGANAELSRRSRQRVFDGPPQRQFVLSASPALSAPWCNGPSSVMRWSRAII
jgi:hypothetical protein